MGDQNFPKIIHGNPAKCFWDILSWTKWNMSSTWLKSFRFDISGVAVKNSAWCWRYRKGKMLTKTLSKLISKLNSNLPITFLYFLLSRKREPAHDPFICNKQAKFRSLDLHQLSTASTFALCLESVTLWRSGNWNVVYWIKFSGSKRTECGSSLFSCLLILPPTHLSTRNRICAWAFTVKTFSSI